MRFRMNVFALSMVSITALALSPAFFVAPAHAAKSNQAACPALFESIARQTRTDVSLEPTVAQAKALLALKMSLNIRNGVDGSGFASSVAGRVLDGDAAVGYASVFSHFEPTKGFNQGTTDYWPGVTLTVTSSKTAQPTRFDNWSYERYVEGVKPWTPKEAAEYRKWVDTQKTTSSFNFDPSKPQLVQKDAAGNTVLTYSESHTASTPLAVRTLEMTMSPENHLLQLSIVSRYVRSPIGDAAISSQLTIVTSP